MKKIALVLLFAVLFSSITSSVFASGGKHHGDKGKGNVVRTQTQVNK